MTLIPHESRRVVIGRFLRDVMLIGVALSSGILLARRRHARVPEAIVLD